MYACKCAFALSSCHDITVFVNVPSRRAHPPTDEVSFRDVRVPTATPAHDHPPISDHEPCRCTLLLPILSGLPIPVIIIIVSTPIFFSSFRRARPGRSVLRWGDQIKKIKKRKKTVST